MLRGAAVSVRAARAGPLTYPRGTNTRERAWSLSTSTQEKLHVAEPPCTTGRADAGVAGRGKTGTPPPVVEELDGDGAAYRG